MALSVTTVNFSNIPRYFQLSILSGYLPLFHSLDRHLGLNASQNRKKNVAHNRDRHCTTRSQREWPQLQIARSASLLLSWTRPEPNIKITDDVLGKSHTQCPTHNAGERGCKHWPIQAQRERGHELYKELRRNYFKLRCQY